MTSPNTITVPGSCSCKAIRYTFTVDPANPPVNILCHCTTCRKTRGSLFSAASLLPSSAFHIDPDSHPALSCHTDTTPESGNTLHRYFCGTCGSPIHATSTVREDMVAVTVGTMDIAPQELALGGWAWKPNVEAFAKNRPAWLREPDCGMTSFEAMPTSSST